jgi:hypothetical protein
MLLLHYSILMTYKPAKYVKLTLLLHLKKDVQAFEQTHLKERRKIKLRSRMIKLSFSKVLPPFQIESRSGFSRYITFSLLLCSRHNVRIHITKYDKLTIICDYYQTRGGNIKTTHSKQVWFWQPWLNLVL